MPDNNRVLGFLTTAISDQVERIRALMGGAPDQDVNLTQEDRESIARWMQRSGMSEVSESMSEGEAESTEVMLSLATQTGFSVNEVASAMQTLANAGQSASVAGENLRVALSALRVDIPGAVGEESILYRGVPIVPNSAMYDSVFMERNFEYNEFDFVCRECGDQFMHIDLASMSDRMRDPHVLQEEVGRQIHSHVNHVCTYAESEQSQSLNSENSYGGSTETMGPNADEEGSTTYSRHAQPELGDTSVHDPYDPYSHIKLPGMVLQRQRQLNAMALRLVGKSVKNAVHDAKCDKCGKKLTSFITPLDDLISNETIGNLCKVAKTHSCLKAAYQRIGVRVIRMRRAM